MLDLGPSRDTIYRQFGSLLRQAREDRNMTQRQLADLVGLKRTSVTNIENGAQEVTLYQIIALASALEMDVASLIPGVVPVELPKHYAKMLHKVRLAANALDV